MPYVKKPIDLDKAKRLYESGLSTADVGAVIGVGAERIRRDFILAGIPRCNRWRKGPANKRRAILPDALICRMYRAGRSEKYLSDKFGVARNCIRTRLIEDGITPRGSHDSAVVRMSQTTAKERRRNTEAAHAAVRGQRQTIEHRTKIAAAREVNQTGINYTERLYALTLSECGFPSILQKAVGPYNIDIALTGPRIAVEIFGGGWHKSGDHAARFRKRTDYLLDNGWLPVIVWHDKSRLYGTGAINYIVTLAQKIRRGEPAGRQEHMIWSNGEDYVIGKRQLNGVPFVPSPNPRDGVTGRFTKRPR